MMLKIHFILLLGLILLKLLTHTESAKILGIFPLRSRSHHAFNQPIVKALAAKGHEVTIISYFKSNNAVSNHREISMRGSSEGFYNMIDNIPIQAKDNLTVISNAIQQIIAWEKTWCDDVFALEYIKELIDSKEEKIDLILAQVHYAQCFHLLAYKLNAPLILLAPVTPQTGVEYFIGNPFNPAVTPIAVSMSPTNMAFWQRLLNAYQYTALYWYQIYKANKEMEEYARRVFNMELPSDEELNKRTALAFYNNHFSFSSRAKSPTLIDIGGVHIEESKPLPKDIEDFIEESSQGVIFFSFGSAIKASSITPEMLKIITDSLSSIPQRVLWRVNDLNITKVPNNVKLGTWFPQRDILEHKNVIAFISHCGIMGLFEAIHTATPIIAIPFMSDQFRNAHILVEKKVAVYVDYSTMNGNTLPNAIREITTNSRYRENMQILSSIFKDRPLSPLDEALYWLEYVLKHRGAPHLRTQAADMPLYQYLLLDVILFLLSIVLGLIYFLKCFFKDIIFKLCRQKDKKIKTR